MGKTIDEIADRVISIIDDIPRRPQMYGLTTLEVEQKVNDFYWFLGILKDRADEIWEAKRNFTPDGRKSLEGSFARIFRFDNPTASEADELAYVCAKWVEIAKALGIAGKTIPS
jgi:hypothetical protein